MVFYHRYRKVTSTAIWSHAAIVKQYRPKEKREGLTLNEHYICQLCAFNVCGWVQSPMTSGELIKDSKHVWRKLNLPSWTPGHSVSMGRSKSFRNLSCLEDFESQGIILKKYIAKNTVPLEEWGPSVPLGERGASFWAFPRVPLCSASYSGVGIEQWQAVGQPRLWKKSKPVTFYLFLS